MKGRADDVRRAAPTAAELRLIAVIDGGTLAEQRRAAAACLKASGELPRAGCRQVAAVSELLTAYGVDPDADLRAVLDGL